MGTKYVLCCVECDEEFNKARKYIQPELLWISQHIQIIHKKMIELSAIDKIYGIHPHFEYAAYVPDLYEVIKHRDHHLIVAEYE